MTDRDRILGLLEEIHSLVEENGNADGTLRIDYFDGLCYTYIVSFKISYEKSE